MDQEFKVGYKVRTVYLEQAYAFGFLPLSSFFTNVRPFIIRVVLSVASFAKQVLFAYSAEIEHAFHRAVKLFFEVTHHVIKQPSSQDLVLEALVNFNHGVHVNANIFFPFCVTVHAL